MKFGKYSLSDVSVEVWLYAIIAYNTFSQSFFGTDEAAKYISAWVLFWLKYVFGATLNVALAVKLFRSQTFSQHRAKQEQDAKITISTPITAP